MRDEHSRTLDQLLMRPYLIGIDHVLWAAKEPKLSLDVNQFGRKSVIIEPDLIFKTWGYENPFFVVEYKNNNKRQGKAKEQLENAAEAIFQLFGMFSYKLFVYQSNGQLCKEYIGEQP